MKAAFNGVPSLRVLDGWWLEGCIEGVTGWSVAIRRVCCDLDEACVLYDKLENVVLPLYYSDRADGLRDERRDQQERFVFNTHRMIRRYATEAYRR